MRGAARALQAGVTVELPVRGGSMAPLFRTGDWLRVAPAAESELRLGDVVVRRAAHGHVAHRVVGLAPLRTRGDAFFVDDCFGDDGALVGRVVARCRRGRWRALADVEGSRIVQLLRALVPLDASIVTRLAYRLLHR